jgi:predicted N-formylglutamate amidohydrolase
LVKVGSDSLNRSTRLLDPGEPEPAIVQNSGAGSPFVLVGDHAGRRIPRVLGDLGLSHPDLERHIAWDIGVAGLGARLADLLGATFVSQRYSRLVIDCNRDPARPDAIPEVSDGSHVHGNAGLTPEDRAAREAEIFAPYHAAIAEVLDARATAPTVIVALHSFTPVMAEFARPWRFGVLHLGESPFSAAVLARFRAEPEIGEVGDNEPYAMDGTDFTIPHHAVARGLDYVELEVRQDLIADEGGQFAVAERLARVLPAALADIG